MLSHYWTLVFDLVEKHLQQFRVSFGSSLQLVSWLFYWLCEAKQPPLYASNPRMRVEPRNDLHAKHVLWCCEGLWQHCSSQKLEKQWTSTTPLAWTVWGSLISGGCHYMMSNTDAQDLWRSDYWFQQPSTVQLSIQRFIHTLPRVCMDM